MSLRNDVDAYLTQRRALGFKLTSTEYLLRQFCGWLETRGKTHAFTIDDAVQWARDRPDAAAVWWSLRLTAVSPFAAWLNACGADVPVIPAALLPAATTRRAPFIYSQTQLDRLLTACPSFVPERASGCDDAHDHRAARCDRACGSAKYRRLGRSRAPTICRRSVTAPACNFGYQFVRLFQDSVPEHFPTAWQPRNRVPDPIPLRQLSRPEVG